jgi:hypothetical protein
MSDTGNRSQDLAAEYVKLGGNRRTVLNDNIVSTRKWADDSAAAALFAIVPIKFSSPACEPVRPQSC